VKFACIVGFCLDWFGLEAIMRVETSSDELAENKKGGKKQHEKEHWNN
jgi:hypothetical protein